jgi:DNA-binding MurR/RpiR family transcriptional regulator
VEQYVQRGASVILITMSTRTTLAKLVTQTVVLPFLSHERCNYLLDDAITFFIFIEMIIEALHEESSKQ